jgi:hypothetical protein
MHLGHVPAPGDATIQKISTDGTATVSVDFTLDLDAPRSPDREGRAALRQLRHQRRAGLRRGGRPGAADRPWPRHAALSGRRHGLVGIEGIQFGQNGSVFIAHNGYFHYGDPGNPAAPDQWPRTNIVAEYMLPDLGGADFDMFALVDVAPSGPIACCSSARRSMREAAARCRFLPEGWRILAAAREQFASGDEVTW